MSNSLKNMQRGDVVWHRPTGEKVIFVAEYDNRAWIVGILRGNGRADGFCKLGDLEPLEVAK